MYLCLLMMWTSSHPSTMPTSCRKPSSVTIVPNGPILLQIPQVSASGPLSLNRGEAVLLYQGGPCIMESREVTSFLSKHTWLMEPLCPLPKTQVSSESLLCILEGTPSSAKLKLGHLGAEREHGRLALSTSQPSEELCMVRGYCRGGWVSPILCKDHSQASAHTWTPSPGIWGLYVYVFGCVSQFSASVTKHLRS